MDEQERQGFIKKIGISADDSDDSDEDEDDDEPEHHKYNCKKCQVRLYQTQTPPAAVTNGNFQETRWACYFGMNIGQIFWCEIWDCSFASDGM